MRTARHPRRSGKAPAAGAGISRIQRLLLHASVLAVALSGTVYGSLKYFGDLLSRFVPAVAAPSQDPFTVVSHPLQPWALSVHVVAAPILVFALGWIFKDHVLGKLDMGVLPARRSGIVAMLGIAPLVLSGYLIQTTTHEGFRLGLAIVHVSAGGLFTLAYGAHLVLASRGRNGGGNSARNGQRNGASHSTGNGLQTDSSTPAAASRTASSSGPDAR